MSNPDLMPTREEAEAAIAADPAARVVSLPRGGQTTLGALVRAVAKRFEPNKERAICDFCGLSVRAATMTVLSRPSIVAEHDAVRDHRLPPKRLPAGARGCWIHDYSAIRGESTPEVLS